MKSNAETAIPRLSGPWKPGLAPFLLVELVIQHLSDQEERSVGD